MFHKIKGFFNTIKHFFLSVPDKISGVWRKCIQAFSVRKTLYSVLVILVCMVIGGYLTASEQNRQSGIMLAEYLDRIEKYKVPVREFGKSASYIDVKEDMVIGIFYPRTGASFMDNPIKDWIKETVNTYAKKNASGKPDTSELAVSYESYLVGESFVSIKMQGEFASSRTSEPSYIIKTFNFDVKNSKLVKLEDVFKKSGIKVLENKVGKILKIETAKIDSKLLERFILSEEGIDIIVNPGEYQKMTDTAKKVYFAYKDISDLLSETFVLKPVADDEGLSEKNGKSNRVIDADRPMIALTFDDGPSIYTGQILDVFAKYGGKATFFVVGNAIDYYPDMLRRIYNEGHEIGSHSWSHRELTKLKKQEIKDQIMMTRAKIFDTIGKDCLIMRPPYGSYDNLVKEVGAELGVVFVNWSVDSLDWESKDSDMIYEEITNNLENGAIVLSHDLYDTTVEAMELVIPRLIEDGYQLVTVSELMSHSKQVFEPGGLYYSK